MNLHKRCQKYIIYKNKGGSFGANFPKKYSIKMQFFYTNKLTKSG